MTLYRVERICSECGHVFGHVMWSTPAPHGTHGLCPSCLAMTIAKYGLSMPEEMEVSGVQKVPAC